MKVQKVEVPELLTAPEVAQLLRCSKYRVYELVKTKKLPSINLGQRGIRFRTDQINQFLGGAADEV